MSEQDSHNRFRGYARISIDLVYRDGITIAEYFAKRTKAEAKQASVLARNFELRGCQRLNHHNFVDVLAEKLDLSTDDVAIQLPASIEQLPLLNEPVRCLHGLHRLLAVCEIIHDESDRWWIARVFSHDLNNGDQTLVSEQFSNEGAGLDGIIFRNIRTYHRRNDTEGENRWWARLTERKRQDLKQLLKDERYSEKFDAMTEWPGLWHPIHLGCLHRLLAMKCDEELLEYLNHIVQTWKEILFGLQDVKNIVDESTVLNLETLVPGSSSADRTKARELMQNGKIFARLRTQHDREVVLQNLLSVEGLIPSLYTFFESLKFLEPCAKIMRRIAPMKGHGSIREGLWSAFHHPARLTVEYATNDVRQHPVGSMFVDRTIGYQQLWLFAFRNFARMCNATTRKNKKEPKPVAREPDPSTWAAFGRLAWRLGFQTKEAKQLRDSDGALELARQIARQSDFERRQDLINAIAAVLKRRPEEREPVIHLKLSTASSLPKNLRCGRPYASDHAVDSAAFFLPAVACPLPSDLFSNVTTFFCKRDMFLKFFGSSTVGAQFDAPVSLAASPCIDGAEDEIGAESEQAQQQGVLLERGNHVSNENEQLRADLREAREETFHINAAFVLEKQSLQNRLADEQAKTRKLEMELKSIYETPSSADRTLSLDEIKLHSPIKGAKWTGALRKIELDEESDLQDAALVGDLILIMLASGKSYRVSNEQAEMVLGNISSGYRYYLADYEALRGGFDGLHGFRALAPHKATQHVGELWKELRVLAIHDDSEPAWASMTMMSGKAAVRKVNRTPQASARNTGIQSFAGTKRKTDLQADYNVNDTSPPAKRVHYGTEAEQGKDTSKGRPAKLFRSRNLFQPTR